MDDYIEFKLTDTDYSSDKTHEGFIWTNSLNEEACRYFATQAEAQQDAMNWEAGRKARYEGSEEEAVDARNRHLNQRSEDARGE